LDSTVQIVSTDGENHGFSALFGVLDKVATFDVRLGGGWGIDVLAERVTRIHHDVDLFVHEEALQSAASRFTDGHEPVQDESPCRIVIQSTSGARIDLNGLRFRRDGHALQVDDEGDTELFPAWGWTQRSVADHSVMCLTAEAQRIKHRGYPERAVDRADLAAIAHIDEPAFFDPAVRLLEMEEEDLIAGIETASDRLLQPFGMWPYPPSDEWSKSVELARTAATLVAGHPPVGFSRLEIVDGHSHLGQLSVFPEYGHIGIGTSLVEASCEWATRRGDRLITLTSFVDVPFNAPWYRRLGFRQLEEPLGSELAEVVAHETVLLQGMGARTVMGRVLGERQGAGLVGEAASNC
jgi:GNAT superfamily N-acetyltransferase